MTPSTPTRAMRWELASLEQVRDWFAGYTFGDAGAAVVLEPVATGGILDVDTETLVRTIDRFLMFYIRTADRLQRTAPWIESLDGGLDYVRDVIVDDALGICAELDAAIVPEAHPGGVDHPDCRSA